MCHMYQIKFFKQTEQHTCEHVEYTQRNCVSNAFQSIMYDTLHTMISTYFHQQIMFSSIDKNNYAKYIHAQELVISCSLTW